MRIQAGKTLRDHDCCTTMFEIYCPGEATPRAAAHVQISLTHGIHAATTLSIFQPPGKNKTRENALLAHRCLVDQQITHMSCEDLQRAFDQRKYIIMVICPEMIFLCTIAQLGKHAANGTLTRNLPGKSSEDMCCIRGLKTKSGKKKLPSPHTYP